MQYNILPNRSPYLTNERKTTILLGMTIKERRQNKKGIKENEKHTHFKEK